VRPDRAGGHDETRPAERPGAAAESGPQLAARWLARDDSGVMRRDAARERMRARSKAHAEPAPEQERDLRGIQLPQCDLSELDLSGFDLSRADLSNADLSGTRLAGAILCEARLCGAKLDGSELLGADLRGADLSECSGRNAGFGRAKLDGAILFAGAFSGATFTQASVRGADARAAEFGGARLIEADLHGSDLCRAMLQGADLEKASVSGASFVDADLRRVRFRGMTGYSRSDWVGVNILDADFCGAYGVRRTIEDQNYLHEFRVSSRLNTVWYWIWWATSDCGRSFLRWGLWTVALTCLFAGLYEGVELDFGAHPTYLSTLYYSVVTLTTLGYGDVVPASPAAQLLAMCEVAVGYVMLGGLLGIFSNKMARRAS